MDLKNGSSSVGSGTDKLPDDMLIYLAKHFLKEQDCLALALSGSSFNFPSLYTANRLGEKSKFPKEYLKIKIIISPILGNNWLLEDVFSSLQLPGPDSSKSTSHPSQ